MYRGSAGAIATRAARRFLRERQYPCRVSVTNLRQNRDGIKQRRHISVKFNRYGARGESECLAALRETNSPATINKTISESADIARWKCTLAGITLLIANTTKPQLTFYVHSLGNTRPQRYNLPPLERSRPPAQHPSSLSPHRSVAVILVISVLRYYEKGIHDTANPRSKGVVLR